MNIKDVIKTGNLIYKITKDIEVNTAFSMPDGCTLNFQGGKLIGKAIITFNNTKILPDGCLLIDYVQCPVSDRSTFAVGQKIACPSEGNSKETASSRKYKMWIGKQAEGNVDGWFYFADADRYLNEDNVATINNKSIIGKGNITIGSEAATIAVADNLTSTSTTDALSANQGRILNEKKVESQPSKTIYDVDDDFLRLSLRKNQQTLTSEDVAQVYQNLKLNSHFVRIGDDYKPIIINGNVTNAPDEEDLTQLPLTGSGKNVIKFKDRPNTDGMGYKILRKNIKGGKNVLTQDMFRDSQGHGLVNTIFEIRYDYVLNGNTITIPNNCVLKFEGGSLSNGTLVGNSTKFISENYQIFGNDIKFSGTWNVDKWCIEWFNNDNELTQNIIDLVSNIYYQHQHNKRGIIEFLTNKEYYCEHIIVKPNVNINLNGSVLNSKSINGIDIRSNVEIYGGIIYTVVDNLLNLLTIGSFKEQMTIENVYLHSLTIKSKYNVGDLITLAAYTKEIPDIPDINKTYTGFVISSKIDNVVCIGGGCTLKFRFDRFDRKDYQRSAPFINDNYINIKWAVSKKYFICDNTSLITQGEVALNEIHMHCQTSPIQDFPSVFISNSSDGKGGYSKVPSDNNRNVFDIMIWDIDPKNGKSYKINHVGLNTFKFKYIDPKCIDIDEYSQNNTFCEYIELKRQDINIDLIELKFSVYCVSLYDRLLVPNLSVNGTDERLQGSKNPYDFVRRIGLSKLILKIFNAGEFTIPQYAKTLHIKASVYYYNDNFKQGKITNIVSYNVQFGNTLNEITIIPNDIESAKYMDLGQQIEGFAVLYVDGFEYSTKVPYYRGVKAGVVKSYRV